MLQNKQEVVWECGAEVDKDRAGLVFGIESFVVLDATWGLEALGGRELPGPLPPQPPELIVKGGCNRKCCGRLAGGRLTGGCWNNSSLGWGSLTSWGYLGQIKDPRKGIPCGTWYM